MLWTQLGIAMRQRDSKVFERARFLKMKDYLEAAERDKKLVLGKGALQGQEWAELHPDHRATF